MTFREREGGPRRVAARALVCLAWLAACTGPGLEPPGESNDTQGPPSMDGGAPLGDSAGKGATSETGGTGGAGGADPQAAGGSGAEGVLEPSDDRDTVVDAGGDDDAGLDEDASTTSENDPASRLP